MKKQRNLIIIVAAIAMVGLYQNCGRTEFSGGDQTSPYAKSVFATDEGANGNVTGEGEGSGTSSDDVSGPESGGDVADHDSDTPGNSSGPNGKKGPNGSAADLVECEMQSPSVKIIVASTLTDKFRAGLTETSSPVGI